MAAADRGTISVEVVYAEPDRQHVRTVVVREGSTLRAAIEQSGLLVDVAVKVGQKVQAGERVAVIEAMKMENVLFAVADGVVGKVLAEKGETLVVDQPIVEFM